MHTVEDIVFGAISIGVVVGCLGQPGRRLDAADAR